MPESALHLAQAKHNEELLAFLDVHDKTEYFRDWYMTVAFYAALHYVEAILPAVAPIINNHRKKVFVAAHYYSHKSRLDAIICRHL